jgi:hypothetical protein
MTINEILSDPKSQRPYALFEPEALRSVGALLTQKNGKLYVRCQVRNKEIQAKPEEIIRQLWLHRLLTHYKYPVTRLISDQFRTEISGGGINYPRPKLSTKSGQSQDNEQIDADLAREYANTHEDEN